MVFVRKRHTTLKDDMHYSCPRLAECFSTHTTLRIGKTSSLPRTVKIIYAQLDMRD
jgi:hypothetical protein